MRWLHWTRTSDRERELDEEIETDFALEIQQRVEAGATREEAEFAARREFGNVGQIKEVTRSMWHWASLDRVGQDLRYGVRMFARTPGFAAAVVIVIALGICATTSLFSIVNAVLLRPLPYRDAHSLTVLWTDDDRKRIHEALVSYPNYEDWNRLNTSFEGLAFVYAGAATISGTDIPERIDVAAASVNLFAVLGVSPVLGRVFSTAEMVNGQHVAVISYSLWQRRFGGEQNALGKAIRIDNRDAIVVGVLPSTFAFPSDSVDIWQPLSTKKDWARLRKERQRPLGLVVGRLKDGITISAAQANMNVIGSQMARQNPGLSNNPDFPGFHVRIVSLADQVHGQKVRTQLWALMGAVGLVLLIACVNVANLLIAKSSARQRELAVRKALGASRSRLLMQLLVESIFLSLVAGLGGISLAPIAIRALVAVAPADLAGVHDATLDVRVLLVALGISLLCGLIFGIAPALQIGRLDANEALKASGRSGTTTKASGRLRTVLVVAEIAVAVLLICSAGLLFRSFLRLQEIPLGFQPSGVLAFRMVLPASMDEVRQAAFYEEALERIRHISGVQSQGAISNLFVNSNPDTTILVEGRRGNASGGEQVIDDAITPGFFRTLGVALERGRLFSGFDGPAAKHVAIINDTFARTFWPGGNPLGKRFQFGDGRFSDPWVTVVGIVGDMRRNGLENEPIPQVFLPMAQLPSRGADFVLRSAQQADALAVLVRRKMAEVDRTIPLYRLSTLESRVAQSISPRRFQTFLFGLFGSASLLLAAIGVYGLAHYTVLQRLPELGIRVALGATRLEILELVVGQNLLVTIIGLAFGICGALFVTRAMKGLLFGISVTDPLTFSLAPALLLVVVLIACARPAWQATRIDPVVALHYE